MKKILLLLAAVTIISCSKDNGDSCTEKVWTAGQSSSGGPVSYNITVGPKSTDVEIITVSQQVYNFYAARIQNNERCYEGLDVGN
jgi:hypothetical protein